MSYKTKKLVELFPDAYSAADPESLLYKILDAIGLQLMHADEDVKRLLKSHWVEYASGTGLDGLAAIFGLTRRRLRTGAFEQDEAFRQRLKAVVRLFTGGGTRQAVLGAVRSALGLPFDLDQLHLPEQFRELRTDIENLITLVEFSPTTESTLFDTVNVVNDASELVLVLDLASTREEKPRIEWHFTSGSGRHLSLELLNTGKGIKSNSELIVGEGETLILATNSAGHLSAVIGQRDLSNLFTNLDDTVPATLPDVPTARSEWKFRANSGLFDISTFDTGDTFEYPHFGVEIVWTRYQPLTFEVRIPYFLQAAVKTLAARRGYTGDPFVFEGLPLERIQDVINQTKALGVQGSVQFSINLYDDQEIKEQSYRLFGQHQNIEQNDLRDSFVVGSVNRMAEDQATQDSLVIGGVFDISPFDGNHGFE